MKTRSLRSRLSFSYAALALVLVALVSVCVNVLFQVQFKNYVIHQQQERNQEVVALLEKQYSEKGWNLAGVENVGVNALEQGIILKLADENGSTLWDATVHNNGLCVQMLSHMAENMRSHYPNFKGGYEQAGYPVAYFGKLVGTAQIGYYGPYYYNDNDIAFLNGVNAVLLAVGAVSLVAALLFGALMAKRISRPIIRAADTAAEISRRNYGQRITEDSGTREFVQLADTVNSLADSLARQDALRRRMAADVAHELRTPLANLQSSLEAMIDGVWQADLGRLASCHEEVVRIGRLVGDLEKLEQAEAENSVLEVTEFDLTELLRRVAGGFEPQFREKGVSLGVEGKEQTIRADRDKIGQVAGNLISNALKYTPAGGGVTVETGGSEQSAEFSVRDTGIGISKEDLPLIFERFYRADRSRNRLTGGSGLGLAIAKAIVEAHRGTIAAESEPGRGSVFRVELPRHP